MSGSAAVFRAFRQPAAMAAIVIGGLLVGACGGGGGGGGGSNTPPPGGNNDPIQPTLASIQEKVFTPICTACHAGAAAPQGLRLEAGMSHAMLVGVASVEVPELLRVEAGNPDDSYIIHKLEGTQTVGDRMPQGGPYLDLTTINAIRQWITDGATASGEDTSDETPTYKGMARLTDGWPVAGSSLPAPPKRIMLIADAELDTSMLHAGSVQVLKIDDVDGLTQKPRQVTEAELMVTSLSPTVITLRVPETEWTPGRYEIRVAGTGAFAVLDRAGQRIDGDADGQPGGDFVMQFDVEAVQ